MTSRAPVFDPRLRPTLERLVRKALTEVAAKHRAERLEAERLAGFRPLSKPARVKNRATKAALEPRAPEGRVSELRQSAMKAASDTPCRYKSAERSETSRRASARAETAGLAR